MRFSANRNDDSLISVVKDLLLQLLPTPANFTEKWDEGEREKENDCDDVFGVRLLT